MNGYTAAKFYKFFNGVNWITLTLISGCALPLFFIFSIIVMDIIQCFETGKVIISDISFIICIWLLVNIPVTIIGVVIGFNQPTLEVSNKPNRVARLE
jgi:Endomembrane protein 70